MPQCRRPQTQLTALLMLAFLGSPAPFAMADSDYSMDWQPKPLVDTSKPAIEKQDSLTTPGTPPVPGQPDLEAKLKPAEPFIQDVESKLSIKAKPGVTLVERLNNLQTVLFGEAKYQDARELLSKLAEIFPQEAAKAQDGLNRELQNTLPTNGEQTGPQSYAKPGSHPTVSMTAPGTNGMMPQPYNSPQMYNPAQQQPQAIAKSKRRHFWQQDDWDSDFKNDPFFQDNSTSYQQTPQQQAAPSKLSSLGQGVAGIAMMAGSLAGAYYLNKKMGNGTINNQPYYNNNPYYSGYGGYGYPYGAYGYGGGYPYGSYYGGYSAYPPPAGAYGSPYGGIITSRPYQSYGSSSFGSISPLGVPTGF